jgi:hypothetical protein
MRGDFTALGRIVRGMQVVDQIELGDYVRADCTPMTASKTTSTMPGRTTEQRIARRFIPGLLDRLS